MKVLILALGALCVAQAANASPCAERVASLQQRFSDNHPAGSGSVSGTTEGATATETTGAKLHHQPTEASVAGAETKADSQASTRAAHFQVLIDQALAAEHSGDAKECEASANEAEKALTP